MSRTSSTTGLQALEKTYTLMQLLKRDYERATADVSDDEWRQQFIADNFSHLKWWEAASRPVRNGWQDGVGQGQ